MKRYGANKATEFTKKQINVVFANAKQGNIKIEKWLITTMYDLADYFGHDYNGSIESTESKVLRVLEGIFSKNYEEAQRWIDILNGEINLYTGHDKFDRTIIA